MLTLNRPNLTPKFHALTIADGVTLRVQVRPPTYEQMVRLWMADNPTESVLIRLEVVTDWLDVFTERDGAEGGREALPFSPEALTELIRVYPDTLSALLKLVNPLFAQLDGATVKNCDAPPVAAT